MRKPFPKIIPLQMMLGVFATVAFIATTCAYGAIFSEDEFIAAYGIDEETRTGSAEFIHYEFPVKLFKEPWTDEERKGILFRASIYSEAREYAQEHEYCKYQHGVWIPSITRAACKVTFFRWVHDIQNSKEVIYFLMQFSYGAQGNSFVLLIPLFQETSEEGNGASQNNVGYISPYFMFTMSYVLQYDSYDEVDVTFDWLHNVLDYGIYQREDKYEINGLPNEYFITRPVLTKRSILRNFVAKVNPTGSQ